MLKLGHCASGNCFPLFSARVARLSAKLSRYWPPAYISARTTAARHSPNSSVPLIEKRSREVQAHVSAPQAG